MGKIEVHYIDHMGSDLSVVNSARVSFGKTKDKVDDADIKLMNYLAKNRHMTPFEHCTLSVRIKCPLFVRSQIHRHRSFSFNEISRRYTAENIEFFIPDKYRTQNKKSKQCSDGLVDEKTETAAQALTRLIHEHCLEGYNQMIDMGVARELARGVLPQNLMTEFWMTGSLRNWIHFLGLRIDSHAQQEAQDVARPILDILKERFPEASKALFKHQLGIDI